MVTEEAMPEAKSRQEPKQMLRVRLVKSQHGRLKKHQACVRGLGLRRIGQTVDVEDTPAVRGMIGKVSYMVEVLP